MHMSNYLEHELIEGILRGNNFTAPANVYLALATSGDESYFAEVSAGEYARQAITFYPQQTSGLTANNAAITFPEATTSWGTISRVGLYDHSGTGSGNQLFWGPLTSNKSVPSGITFQVEVSGITVQLF